MNQTIVNLIVLRQRMDLGFRRQPAKGIGEHDPVVITVKLFSHAGVRLRVPSVLRCPSVPAQQTIPIQFGIQFIDNTAILARVTDNNTQKVRAHFALQGTALFDLPPDQWPRDIPIRVYPEDRASQALVQAACGRSPTQPTQGLFIPASVMLGEGRWARHSSGVLRGLSRLLKGRRARIRFGQPSQDIDQPKQLYYQGVPPATDTLAEIQRRVLAEPSLRAFVQHPSDEKRVRRLVRELAARPSPALTRTFDGILNGFWSRFYQGIDVQGLTEARQGLQDRVPIYLVTHRSHLDYLLISWLLFRAGLTPPVIAAGINLNLPVIGRILRAGGAFFIRRQFKGDPLYQQTVKAYMASLVRRRQPILIFPEGGRSRDGQCRTLKLGLVKDLIDSAQHTPMAIVPVTLAYDRMPDSQGYRAELEGAKKSGEKLSDLPKAWRLLRSEPLGRVRCHFGTPYDLPAHSPLDAVGERLLQSWQAAMPASPVARIGLLLPGFAGHRARLDELERALEIVDEACDLPRLPDSIAQAQSLGYLTLSGQDPIVHAPQQARDQLLYAAGAVKHRACALALLAIGHLAGASTRRTQALFDLAWPALALNLHIAPDYRPALEQARKTLKNAQLDGPDSNANYRLLAALAEPVVADVTRLLSVLSTIMEAPNQPLDQWVLQARQKARDAMLLSGRSELSVLDLKPYRAFIDQLEHTQALINGRLTRKVERLAKRWLAGFAQIDRQFLI